MSVNSGPEAWLLHDGRAGHWRQVRALAHYLPLEESVLPVNLRLPWRWFAPYRLPFGLAAHPGLLEVKSKQPQVIVSCGRRSALAARWLQRYFDGRPKTVQILDCGLPPDRFSWVIAPRHDELEGGNVIPTIGSLNPVSEEWLEQAVNLPVSGLHALKPRLVLLLGGPSSNFSFSRRWLRASLASVCEYLAGGSLTIVDSPRTPGWVADEIDRLPAEIPRHRIAWSPQDAEGSERRYGAALALADFIVVSADSVNLVSEACASGKPVNLIGVGQVRGKIARFCNQLIDEGFAHVMKPGQTKNGAVPPTRCLRETKDVAERLIESGLLD